MAGKVISVSGVVLIRSGEDPGAKSQVLRAGTFFRSSDVFVTSSNGAVKLLFNDRSIVDVGPSTLFEVKKFEPKQGNDRQVDLDLTYGAVRSVITKPLQGKGRFRIRTPSATMGVRGTEFLVKSSVDNVIRLGNQSSTNVLADRETLPSENQMEVVVIQGKVDVAVPTQPKSPGMESSNAKNPASTGVVSLSAGQALLADAKSQIPSTPVTLSTEQVTAAVSTSKIEDSTFKKAIVIDLKTQSGSDSSRPQQEGGERVAATEKPKTTTETASSGRSPDSVLDSPPLVPGSITQDIVQEVVIDSVAPVISAPTAPAVPNVDVNSYIPVIKPPEPVVIPPGGLRHLTIKVTR